MKFALSCTALLLAATFSTPSVHAADIAVADADAIQAALEVDGPALVEIMTDADLV